MTWVQQTWKEHLKNMGNITILFENLLVDKLDASREIHSRGRLSVCQKAFLWNRDSK